MFLGRSWVFFIEWKDEEKCQYIDIDFENGLLKNKEHFKQNNKL